VSLDPKGSIVALLGGTTSLLLLAVFAVVNVAVLVLRKQPVDHKHFRTPTVLPIIGAITCLYLVFPWTSGRPAGQYTIALGLLALGILLWIAERIYSRTAARRSRARVEADSGAER
jgi:amino acid transporter